MLFNRDSTIQKCFRRFYTICKSEISVPDQPSGRRVILSGRSSVHSSSCADDVSYRPGVLQAKASSSRRCGLPSEHSSISRSFCSSLHPSGQLSVINRASDFLSKSKYGKIAATVWTTWIPVGTRYSLRQVRNSNLLVFWPYSVFGQNHLCVMMRQTGIPLFRVKSEEFQSSLSAVQTMCHPVRTPICLLFHLSGRRVIPSGHQIDKHHLSGRRAYSVRTPTLYREASVPACSVRTF
jgi:hypothetical protein